MMAIKTAAYVMRGGLDLESPHLTKKDGALIDAINYECLPFGGYKRVLGYEKFDGQVTEQQDPAGSGSILGIWWYMNNAYCVRNNAGGTAAVLFKSSVTGWVAQSLGSYLKFKQGSAFFSEGDVVTGVLSGHTATVARVSNLTGSTSGGDLTGLIVLTAATGNFQDNEDLQVSAGNVAKADGILTAAALPVGGSYRFWNYNFLANASSQRMYGANGVGYAFEWDGTIFTPILRQVNNHWPSLVVGHNDHLFLGFGDDGIIESSSIGEPRDYLSTTGAVAIGVGDIMTDMRPTVGGVLVVGCKNSVQILYGNNATNWDKKRFSDHGVRARTMKEIGGTMVVLDSRGVQRFDQTERFGDFYSTSMSVPINRRLLPILQLNAAAVSLVSKNKDQYRVFFGTSGYYFSFQAGRMVGVMPVTFKHNVRVACEGELENGDEIILFGDDAGSVYRMDHTNFYAGQNILAGITLEYMTQNAPTRDKQYRKFVVYLDVEGAKPVLQARASFNFDDGSVPPTPFSDMPVPVGGGTQWDEGQWDTFEWAADGEGAAEVYLAGTGENMSLNLISTGFGGGMHTLESGVVHYSPRRLNRG